MLETLLIIVTRGYEEGMPLMCRGQGEDLLKMHRQPHHKELFGPKCPQCQSEENLPKVSALHPFCLLSCQWAHGSGHSGSIYGTKQATADVSSVGTGKGHGHWTTKESLKVYVCVCVCVCVCAHMCVSASSKHSPAHHSL
jgi:hypothetical protein